MLDLPNQFLLLDSSATSWDIVSSDHFAHNLNVGIANNTMWVAIVALKMILPLSNQLFDHLFPQNEFWLKVPTDPLDHTPKQNSLCEF